MSSSNSHNGACHNCRRRRLRCDRSSPHCLQCIKRGQVCLGYQRLFRWEQGVASRGKMAGKTYGQTDPVENRASQQQQLQYSNVQTSSGSSSESSPTSTSSHDSVANNDDVSSLAYLTDPLLQDLDRVSRKYLVYFASDVCKDLVLYDVPKHNAFRELIPLTQKYPVLLQIIIANAALRMSNACGNSPTVNTLQGISNLSLTEYRQPESHNDALIAKQRALYLLNSALTTINPADIDVTLAVVLLFIEYELLDSGCNSWKYHINGARTIIRTICELNSEKEQVEMSSLRSSLISNCLVFDILGSTLQCSNTLSIMPSDLPTTGTLSLLKDAEGNHCTSFPIALLHLIRAGAQVSQDNPTLTDEPSVTQERALLLLIYAAQSFAPHAWAADIQPHSPVKNDYLHRVHIAYAHRAAVCIYLSRLLLKLYPESISRDLEPLAGEIITHLSCIRPRHALFTATTWPAFIAGAETSSSSRQEWVTRRFREMWEVEPWGNIRGALGVLNKIWADKKDRMQDGDGSQDKTTYSWIETLKNSGVDWLIL